MGGTHQKTKHICDIIFGLLTFFLQLRGFKSEAWSHILPLHCNIFEIMLPKQSCRAQPVFPAQLYRIITILDAVIKLSSVLIFTKVVLHVKEGINWLFLLVPSLFLGK